MDQETLPVTDAEFSHNLLQWYAQHQRDLPWRRTKDPYAILVSEIMLQQTQVDRVIDYFQRWLKQFPDIPTLAAASEEEVLKYWEGLGYYSRAKNLHKTAHILDGENGILPNDHDALLELPGIGPYTAAAVMSIAFDQDKPLVDANVERVLSRYYNVHQPIKSKEAQTIFWKKAQDLLPTGKASQFNQAIMELGALICTKQNPQCPECPISQGCKARRLGITDQRPVKAKPKKTIFITMACGIIQRNDTFFIQKRHDDDIWAGLWEFPGGRLKDGEEPEQGMVREVIEETELKVVESRFFKSVSHSYMHYKVTLHGYFCTVDGDNEPVLHAAQAGRWVTKEELSDFAFPAGHRKLIKMLP